MADLRTDYVDDVLDLTKNTNRKYLMRDKDGNILQEDISLEETTEFEVEGSTFGARDINETNARVNEINEKLAELDKTVMESGEATVSGTTKTVTLKGKYKSMKYFDVMYVGFSAYKPREVTFVAPNTVTFQITAPGTLPSTTTLPYFFVGEVE